MCLALPARVVALVAPDQALIDLGGIRKTVSVALTPEAAVGDYVIVHVGHAIGVLDADEAERTLALFAELALDERKAVPDLLDAQRPRAGPAGSRTPGG